MTVVGPAGPAGLAGREHRRLVAYVACGAGRAPHARELRDFLRERLPSYMVPAAYVALDALPLTPSGKLDRKALPAPAQEDAGEAPVAPRTPAEELVAGIFAGVLGVERVGIRDDFFALGGHSLLATQLASRVRAVFGVELPVRTVFEAPTVEALAAWLEASRAGEGEEGGPLAPIVPLAPIPREGPLALSFAQQRLWFLDLLEPGSPMYNLPAAIELTGRLDVPAMAAALGEVVRRHEALRTTFRAVGGEPVQVIAVGMVPPLPLIDLQALPAALREGEAERLRTEEARRPFDLGRGPLLRTSLLRSGSERHSILLTMHHIVSDGWSMGVLVRELGALYAAGVTGPEPAAGARRPVRGLRRLAARAPLGRADGRGARVVAAATRGHAAGVGAAGGPSAGGHSRRAGSEPRLRAWK